MSLAKNEIDNALVGKGCLGKADDNEPVFILRAQDLISPMIVRNWAYIARAMHCNEAKVEEALRLADAMEEWPKRKWPD